MLRRSGWFGRSGFSIKLTKTNTYKDTSHRYYSSEEDACHQFTSTGRGGNENNFLSEDACQETCPGFRGFCPHAKPYLVQVRASA